MACNYTLNLNGTEQTFPSERALRDYIQANPGAFAGYNDSHDIPETFEGQRDQFIDRWKLTPTERSGQYGYTSKGSSKATLALARKMTDQLQKRSGGLYDKLAIKYDSTYGLIHIQPFVRNIDLSGPQYDVSEDEQSSSGPSRTFNQLPNDFKITPGDQSRYFLSPANYKNDTYARQGEYFNVSRNRIGTAVQMAKTLGISVDQLKERVKGSNLQPGYLNDFLAGKSTVRLSLYQVDRVSDPEQFVNPAEDQAIGSFRRSKVALRGRLQQRIRQETDPKRKADLYKQLNEVKAQLKELNKPDNQNMAYIKKVFQDDKEAFGTKKYDSLRDIDQAYALFNGYETLFKAIDTEPFGPEVEQEFKDHLRDIAQIKAELQRDKGKVALQQMELKTSTVLANEEGELLPIKDINALSSWTLALSTTQNNPLVRYIGQTSNFAVNKGKDKITDKKEEVKKSVDELVKWGKTQGLTGIKLYNYMLEEEVDPKDGLSKPNGHFVVKYGRFYTDLAKTLKGKNEKDIATNFLKYLRNNTENVESLKGEFQEEWNKIHSSVIERIRQRGPDLTENEINDAAVIEANKISYGINPDNFKSILDRYSKGGLIDDKDMAYIKNFLDRGAYYKFIKLTPKEEFRDQKYKHIDSLPEDHPQKVFYRLFSEFHYEVNERVRVDEGAMLRRNFIAEYKKDYKDEDESWLNYLKDTTHDWALGMLTESPRDNIQGLDPLTKEITRAIPFYAFNGRIDPEDKNYNLGKVLGVLAQQYFHYEAMSDVEDDLLMAHYLLQNTPTYEVNSFGSPVIINGEPVIKKDTSAVYKQADYHIMAVLYNERMKKDGIGGNKYYDSDTKRRIEELDKLQKEQGELTAEQADEYRKLKANYTSSTVKKGTNALMYWTSMKNIGFNLFGGLAEIFQGTSSLYLRYGGKEWFSTVLPTLLQLVNPMDSEAKHKLDNLKKMFHVESDVNPNIEESKMKKIAYAPYSIARVLANSGYLIAILKDQKLKDKDGAEHSLHDIMSFDEKGKIVLPNNFENPFYNPDGSYSEYKYKLQQIVNKEIRQNRDRETDIDPIQMDKHFWGRLLGQFKASWLFEGMATRFGAEREGLNDLDTASKGIYRSFWDMAKTYVTHTNALGEEERSFSVPRTLLKAMINVVKFSTPGRLTGWGKRGESSQLDYEGAVRTVREIQSALFLYGMVMLISGMAHGDDRDKWKKMGLTYLANYFMRTQRDMSSYFDPDSLMSIVNKNVIPALDTVQEAVKLIEDPFHGIFGNNWYYNQGKSNEQFKITRDAADLVPLMNQLRMIINKATKQQAIFY